MAGCEVEVAVNVDPVESRPVVTPSRKRGDAGAKRDCRVRQPTSGLDESSDREKAYHGCLLDQRYGSVVPAAVQDGVASVLNDSNLFPQGFLGTCTTKVPQIYTTKFRENVRQEVAVLVATLADGQICDEACRRSVMD